MKKNAKRYSFLLVVVVLVACYLANCSQTLTTVETPTIAANPSRAGVPPLVFQVHPEKTFQTIVGFGTSFGNGVHVAMIEKEEDRSRVYDLLYGESEGGARLNIVRIPIWLADPLSKTAPLYAQGFHYNWDADRHTQSTWRAVEPVLKRTKPIIYAVGFTPPGRWKTNNSPINGGALKREHYQDYAEYLTDFVDYYHRVLHVDIDVLSIQGEPDFTAPFGSCIWTGTELRDFLKVLAPTLRTRRLNTMLMLSEGSNWSEAWRRLEPTLHDPTAVSSLNLMASHSYGDPMDGAMSRFASASQEYGLPVWMSEMSLIQAPGQPPAPDDPGMNAAIRVAGYMHRDLVEAHASAWIYCLAIYSLKEYAPGMGILSPAGPGGTPNGKFIVPKRFWAMAHYSRFVLPGWKLMSVTKVTPGESPDRTAKAVQPPDRSRTGISFGFVNTAFVSPDGKRLVIVAVNSTSRPQLASYDFGTHVISRFKAYCTTANFNLSGIPVPDTGSGNLSTTVPPMSITTFVGEIGGGA